MALAFPGIVLYGIALFAARDCIRGERKVYHYLEGKITLRATVGQM